MSGAWWALMGFVGGLAAAAGAIAWFVARVRRVARTGVDRGGGK